MDKWRRRRYLGPATSTPRATSVAELGAQGRRDLADFRTLVEALTFGQKVNSQPITDTHDGPKGD